MQELSLETQEQDCRAFCATEGFSIVDVVYEVGERDELEERQGLRHVREMFHRNEVDVLVVWKYDRLSGEPTQQSAVVYDIVQRSGGKILSTRETLEDGPVGELVRYVKGFGAHMEVEAIRLRIRRGREARVERGHHLPHHKPAYGYRWETDEKKGYVINEDEAPVVRRIFDALSAGVSAYEVARQLNVDGIPGPTGGRWEPSRIRRMVRNPVYWGRPQMYRSREVKTTVVDPITGEAKKVARRLRKDTNPVSLPPQPHLAIVTGDVAAAVDHQLSLHNTGQPRGSQHENYLLRGGFIFCGHCGRQMTCWAPLPEKRMYTCRSRLIPAYEHVCPGHNILARTLDEEAWTAAVAWVRDPSVFQRAVQARMASRARPDDALIESYQQTRDQARSKARRLYSIIDEMDAENDPDLRDILALYKRAQEDARKAQEYLNGLEERRQTWEAFNQGVTATMAWCHEAVKRGGLTFIERRRVLYALGVKVTVWKRGTHDPRCLIELLPHASGEGAEVGGGERSGILAARRYPWAPHRHTSFEVCPVKFVYDPITGRWKAQEEAGLMGGRVSS